MPLDFSFSFYIGSGVGQLALIVKSTFMRRIFVLSTASLILLPNACAPLVSTHAKAPGVQTTSECFTEGGEAFVRLRVVSGEEGAPWTDEFAERAPEKLVVEADRPLTRIRWKVGRDRRFKALGIAPCELRLSSGDRAFKVTVSFRTTSQQVIGAFLQTVASIH